MMNALALLFAILWVVELERVDEPTAPHEWISGEAAEVASLRGGGGELPIAVSVKTVADGDENVCRASVVNSTTNLRVKCLNVRPFVRDVPADFEGVYCPCGLGVRFPRLPAATDGDVSCGWERFAGIDRKRVYAYHCDWPIFPGNYPGYRATMAYTVLAGAAGGVYWGCHDPAFKAKCMRPLYDPVGRRMTFTVDFHANVMPGSSWRSAPVVERPYRGRWHVAAKRYRHWFDSVVRLPKKRLSDEMTGQVLCILKQQNGEIVWPYGELDALADVALSHGLDWVGLFGWTKGGHDHLYPDYEPDPAQGGEAELREGIRRLHAKGLRCYLYANGQLIEHEATEFWNGVGKTCGIVRPDGRKYEQTWHKYANTPPHRFDLGCLSGEAWYGRMLAVARRAQGLGADGLLYDQLANSQPQPCYSAAHGHAPGDMAFADDKTRFLRRIRDEIDKVDPDFVLASEGLGDTLADPLAFCHGMCPGAHPYDKCCDMVRRRFRGERAEGAEVYPEFFRYTFPEIVSTCRVPSPILARDYVNYDCIFGLRHEMEIRYSPDRRYVETGRMPDIRDYGPILGPPDLKLMAASDQRTARGYLKAVCDFQRRWAKYFLRGTYCDDDGVVLAEGGLAAKRLLAADGTSAVLVWNPGDQPRTPRFVKPGTPRAASSPEKAVEAVDGPVPPNGLRLYLFGERKEVADESRENNASGCGFSNGDRSQGNYPTAAPWRAKWIAPNPLTRPDVDFGAAKWVSSSNGAFRAAFELDRVPEGPVEGVAIGTGDGCRVTVNGRKFIEPCGFVRDGSRLCRGDLSRFLKSGTNVIEAHVENAPRGTPSSLLLAFLSGGRPFFVSDADWRNALGDPVRVEGAPRAVAWDAKFDYSVEVASPAFEKRFSVTGTVASATLRITAAGFYEAQLDGVKIGDKVLDPSPTDYSKRILYSEYPVALTPGEHVLRILVGHGWYDMRTCATWNFDLAPWRKAPRTIAELTVRFADGREETIVTDRTWRQVKSPVAYDDIREGEIAGAYDPRMPDLEAIEVHPVEVPQPCRALERADLPGAKKVRAIRPEKIVRTGDGAYTAVFPETLAGWTRFTFRRARKGDVVTLRYDEHVGENLAPVRNRIADCFFYRSGSCGILPGGAFQQDRIVASGAPEETFEPRFVYHGFQYVHLSGLRTEPQPDDIVAYEVRTDFPKTGSFVCSDENLNRLVALADASYRGNFTDGYPTDCPQREKLGWTADAALACRFAQYLYDNTAAYRKWVVDIGDAQREDGALPGIVPTGGWGFALYNGASWDYAIAEIPWTVYEHRGDRRILELAYPALLKYVKYEVRRCPSGLVDWGIMEDWHPIKTKTSPAFMSTAYFIRTAHLAARIAEVLGRAEDRAFCSAAEACSRAAFQKAFARGNGVFGPGGQTAQAIALNFGLVPPDEIPAARLRLVDAFRERDDHVDVGIQGFANVFDALSEMGRTDLAYRVLTRDTPPSPLDWVKGGETTLGDYIRANAGSRNHVMYGTFVAWAFRHLAGIAPAEPGYARAVVAPKPVPALSFVRAAVRTPKGELRSSWKVADGVFTLEVSVPAGVPTDVRLPDGTSRTVDGGEWKFRSHGLVLARVENSR